MIRRAGRTGGALSVLALLALVAAGLATAGSPPAPVGPAKPGKVRLVGQSGPGQTSATPAGVHAVGYRLTAKLTPSSSSSTASGRWDGVLVHMIGTVQAGAMPSIPGCSVTGPKPGAPPQPGRSSGIPHKIKCGGTAVPPFTVPSSGQHWILGWKLSYANLSSAVNGADIRLNSPGAAGVVATTLCGPCTSGKFGRTTLTDDQAAALLKGNGYVVVRTATNQDGEISGQIVKVAPTAAHH